MPISLKIEPSAMCQLACPGCVQSSQLFKIQSRNKIMGLPLFERILEQAGEYLYRIQFYDNGEPFINKQLLDMILLATARNIGSQVSTNFSFPFSDDFYRRIVESGLEHLIVAMDGVSQHTYSQYRVNGRYELVESGLRQIVKWKRRLGRRYPFVEWQFILFDHNKHEVDAAKALAKEIGVDRLCLKYDAASDASNWTRTDRLRHRTIRKARLNSCLWLWGGLVIDTDGHVSPCCNAGRSEEIGDLNVTPLRELWNSCRMQELRRCVHEGGRQGAGSFSPCEGCPHIM
jgi:radical SAM protein with 4Fe4S-binding SPASM domain